MKHEYDFENLLCILMPKIVRICTCDLELERAVVTYILRNSVHIELIVLRILTKIIISHTFNYNNNSIIEQ